MSWAGAAKVNITPEHPVFLGGYEHRREPSVGMRDDLFVKALVLQDDRGRRCVIVTYDLLGVDSALCNELREDIRRLYRIPPDRVCFLASHTHSAPDGLPHQLHFGLWTGQGATDSSYRSVVRERTMRSVEAALDQLQAARLAVCRRMVRCGGNRRNPHGPRDHEADILSFRGTAGEEIATIFHYACHPTVLSPASLRISADFPGAACRYVEQQTGGICLYVNGAAGNISTRFTRSKDRERDVERFGHELGQCAVDALRSLSRSDDWECGFAVAMSETNITLPGKEGEVTALLQYIRIGPAECLLVPGEWFIEYALRLKAEYPRLAVWGYANDYIGYVPTALAFQEGGYEPEVSRLLPSCEQRFMDQARVWIETAARKAGDGQ